MDGTRTFLIGRTQVALVDPGSDMEDHIRALSAALKPAREVWILLTHGHGDHAGAACALAQQTGASLLATAPRSPLQPPHWSFNDAIVWADWSRFGPPAWSTQKRTRWSWRRRSMGARSRQSR